MGKDSSKLLSKIEIRGGGKDGGTLAGTVPEGEIWLVTKGDYKNDITNSFGRRLRFKNIGWGRSQPPRMYSLGAPQRRKFPGSTTVVKGEWKKRQTSGQVLLRSYIPHQNLREREKKTEGFLTTRKESLLIFKRLQKGSVISEKKTE